MRIYSHVFPVFLPKKLCFKNKHEPTKRQLCQWRRMVHNDIQSFSILLFLDQRLEIETVYLENSKLNPNNSNIRCPMGSAGFEL